jgi:hypothetical protein
VCRCSPPTAHHVTHTPLTQAHTLHTPTTTTTFTLCVWCCLRRNIDCIHGARIRGPDNQPEVAEREQSVSSPSTAATTIVAYPAHSHYGATKRSCGARRTAPPTCCPPGDSCQGLPRNGDQSTPYTTTPHGACVRAHLLQRDHPHLKGRPLTTTGWPRVRSVSLPPPDQRKQGEKRKRAGRREAQGVNSKTEQANSRRGAVSLPRPTPFCPGTSLPRRAPLAFLFLASGAAEQTEVGIKPLPHFQPRGPSPHPRAVVSWKGN